MTCNLVLHTLYRRQFSVIKLIKCIQGLQFSILAEIGMLIMYLCMYVFSYFVWVIFLYDCL